MSKSLGICLGASTIKVASITESNGDMSIEKSFAINHESNPRDAVIKLFTQKDQKDGIDLSKYDNVVVTGRKFREVINADSITEPEAIESAITYLSQNNQMEHGYTALASLGAESFIVYLLNEDSAIASVESGNKCASGTGEFFLQQIGRMNIDTDKAIELAKDSTSYRVSGRCSVFCKSDCTHALNKGVEIGRVAAGLGEMMAEKVLDLLEKMDDKKILAVGGVTKNSVVMDILEKKVDKLTVPEFADVFEALGAAFYAHTNKTGNTIDVNSLFKEDSSSFMFLPPISKGESLVSFKEVKKGVAKDNDECVVGLDVGSTTTKAVVLRTSDCATLASVYLRTNGNPVEASKQCYKELLNQIDKKVNIVGLGATGSGRHIAGLHATTDSIINEIIAHATGAAFYDSEVDTIFEIGGQDAKYTHLTNAVPSDYAMNEACSAGTGSFLEESALESLGVKYTEIEKIAQKGENPPNFNDQCAAFISSDIKIATHEGIKREDILAGLVYSICMNYVNRVKGQRSVGNKIFMQGGVCYNKAVPLAMANLIEKPIIVPPDPGLIGAFGVAVEVKNRIEQGLASKSTFNLKELSLREIETGKSFKCAGGKEGCDLGCEINMIIIEGNKYPFGGACNKYYNQVHHIEDDNQIHDYIKIRQDTIFENSKDKIPKATGKIGISRSFLINTYFQMYKSFFNNLGYDVELSNNVEPNGIKMRRSSFCYPAEIAHGSFYNLLLKGDQLDYIFQPKVMGLPVEKSVNSAKQHQSTCVLLQTESYYLQSAFKHIINKDKMITPLIDYSTGLLSQKHIFIDIAKKLGCTKQQGINAFESAVKKQNEVTKKLKEYGKKVLQELEKDSSKTAIVLFGRPYNSFATEANMGIPGKFATRGVITIPWDMLAFEDSYCDPDMCWALGQNLMKTADYVEKHPQLFGTWVTNFSCGPDSFLVGYFRNIMKTKPSLTLELDSHTADAGINTRIEAFLDIINRYREVNEASIDNKLPITPAEIVFKGRIPDFVSSNGTAYKFTDEKVHLLIPSMGRFAAEILASSMEGIGVKASAVPIYDYEALKFGRANSSCKECLPLQLTTGGLLKYIEHRKDSSEMLAYFMPFTPGNCRFPQYRVFLNNLIKRKRLENVAIFSLTAAKGYMHDVFSTKDRLGILKGFIISDIMDDIQNAVEVLAVDIDSAKETFETEWARIKDCFSSGDGGNIYKVLETVAKNLSQIELKKELKDAKKVTIVGEIFVRRDEFSCRDLTKQLTKKGFVIKKSPFFEWLKYVDYIVQYGVYQPDFTFKAKIQFAAKQLLQNSFEKKIKKIFEKSNLYEYEVIDIKKITDYGKRFFDLQFRGESILAVGGFFKEIAHSTHGVVSIGPFACMPLRVIEAVLSVESTLDVKKDFEHGDELEKLNAIKGINSLPFLSVETDGNPFPQILEARVEAFCLQAERLYEKIGETKVHF